MEQIINNLEEENVNINNQVLLPANEDIGSNDCPTTSVNCLNEPFSFNLDSFSIGDFVRLSTKSSHFRGELIQIDLINEILLLKEQSFGKSTLHFVKKCGILSIEKCMQPYRIQKRRSSNLKHVNSLSTINEIENRSSENALKRENEPFIGDEQAKRTFSDLKRIFDDVIWDGSNIFVLKCIKIFHPYDYKSIEATDSRSSSVNALARVQKILEMRRGYRTIPSLLSLNLSIMDVVKYNPATKTCHKSTKEDL